MVGSIFCLSNWAQCRHRLATAAIYDRMVRAFASGAVDSSLIPSRVKPMTLKLVLAASLLDAQRYRDSVENKPASLLVVPLGKALNGIPPSWCGKQMPGNS